MTKPRMELDDLEQVAGNGLLHRRVFLSGGAALLGAAALPLGIKTARAAPPDLPDSMRAPGKGMTAYGSRAKYESHVQRMPASRPGTTGSGGSRTPLESLEGTITPSALHFERHHSGVPDIAPDEHRLLLHGAVDRPLLFSVEALSRYPLVSRIHFIECSGNSRANSAPEPPRQSAGALHGLVSCSDWTGVPLSILLDEAGIRPEGRWLLAEGGDAAAMSRSIPLAKAMDDALIALYQNGERLRPEQGYPMRLLLPGWEGNTNVKWLRRIEVTAEPTMARDETSKYTDLLPDGKALMFTFPMGVKSVITSPSGGLRMSGPGLYQISGIAWSGAGAVRRVEISADGGRSWAAAALSDPVLPKALTRFRMAWRWNGGPAILQSRAVDDSGAVQPTRTALLDERGPQYGYHFHAIQSWAVSAAGEVSNVYA
jgi:sulfane dehydrogenase subunit SoxC